MARRVDEGRGEKERKKPYQSARKLARVRDGWHGRRQRKGK